MARRSTDKPSRATKAELLAELRAAREQIAALERRAAPAAGGPGYIHAILEAAPDFISSAAPDGRILFINAAGRALAGIGPDEDVSGRQISDFHPAWAYELIERVGLPQAIRDGAWQGEAALIDRTGREIPTSQVITAHRTADGTLQFVSTIIRDISTLKRAEEERRTSEARFRAIVESSPMGIHLYELRADGRLVFLDGNPAADAILGVDHARFVGQTIEEAFPRLEQTEVPQRYRDVAARGGTWQTEQIDYEDERIRGAFEVYAFQTGPGRMAALFLDVTQRKRDAAEREALTEQLWHAQKMEAIGRLAGGVAHDFNNLLTGITGYAEILVDALPVDDPLRGDAQEIHAAAERAARLTNQLRTFSRKQPAAPLVLDPNAVIRRSQRMLERIIGEDVRLVFHPGEPVWNVCIDPLQLEQVLVNLAVNARDAMPAGGTLTIETRNTEVGPPTTRGEEGPPEHAAGRFVCLVVRDSGVGMDDRTLRRIFEPFFTTKGPTEGTGLGLAMVYGVVQQNHGHIRVASRPGAGTTFRLLLPAVDGETAPLEQLDETQPPSGAETVLLVEDDATTRKLATKLLRRHGYHVIAASSGEAALELAAACEPAPALLLTDIVMPGMNGKALFDALRALWPALKVLYTSGHHESVLAHHAAGTESSPFISKPFSSRSLSTKVREVLDADGGP